MKIKLKKIVSEGQGKKLLNWLLANSEKISDTSLQNEIILLNTRLTDYEKTKRAGTHSPDQLSREKARIDQSLLSMIDQLDIRSLEGSFDEMEQLLYSPDYQLKKNWPLLVFVLLIPAYFYWYPAKEKTSPSPTNTPTDSLLNKDTATSGEFVLETTNQTESSERKSDTQKNKANSDKHKPINQAVEETASDSSAMTKVGKPPKEAFEHKLIRISSKNLGNYKISKYEVSIRQYLAFCNATNHLFPKEVDTTKLDNPITYVSWKDAVAYCKYVNGRLPTLEEWEWAATGGSKSRGYKYSGGDIPQQVAWSHLDEISGPQAIGKKAPNELGIYDMSGNVREWCKNESSIENYRYVKGGGWKSLVKHLRPDHEAKPEKLGLKNSTTGFRVAF